MQWEVLLNFLSGGSAWIMRSFHDSRLFDFAVARLDVATAADDLILIITLGNLHCILRAIQVFLFMWMVGTYGVQAYRAGPCLAKPASLGSFLIQTSNSYTPLVFLSGILTPLASKMWSSASANTTLCPCAVSELTAKRGL